MHRSDAKKIADVLHAFSLTRSPDFDLSRTRAGRSLNTFHKWADGKPLVSADRIVRDDGNALHLLLIDWNASDNFYCVLYPDDQSNPLAELWKLKTTDDGAHLSWAYRPVKRDGRNEERKQYFERHVGALTLQISIPQAVPDVPRFLRDLFALRDNRSAADALTPNEPETREDFPEGDIIEKLHRSRERNAAVVALAKRRALEATGKLACAVCKFDFHKRYGNLGYGFIEAHHAFPLSKLTGRTKTRIEDLVLVCSNCHRMIHRVRPWLPAESLGSILPTSARC